MSEIKTPSRYDVHYEPPYSVYPANASVKDEDGEWCRADEVEASIAALQSRIAELTAETEALKRRIAEVMAECARETIRANSAYAIACADMRAAKDHPNV